MSVENGLMAGVFTGALGAAYFVYGKKQGKIVPFVAGIALSIYPYFFEDILWLVIIGLGLAVLPFVIKLEF